MSKVKVFVIGWKKGRQARAHLRLISAGGHELLVALKERHVAAEAFIRLIRESVMFETSSDDLFLPSSQDQELVENLLCSEGSDDEGDGDSLSLARALLPLVESSLPLVTSWVCSTRYKTDLCTSYSATGFCKYAERCQFAHGLQELQVPFRHPKYKTELCRNYHTTGYCYYGTRCLFVHDPAEQRRNLRRRNVPCRTFHFFGVCPFGTRCNFLHGEASDGGSSTLMTDCVKTPSAPVCQSQSQSKAWKPKITLCHTFRSFGFCLYGTRCRFQHGLPSTIKTSDQSQGQDLSPQLSPCRPGLSSSTFSSTSTSSPPVSPLDTPEPTVHNAFTFSSQHLNDHLQPLALHLQQLQNTQAQGMWESREL